MLLDTNQMKPLSSVVVLVRTESMAMCGVRRLNGERDPVITETVVTHHDCGVPALPCLQQPQAHHWLLCCC